MIIINYHKKFMMESDAKGACSCSHHKVMPSLVVLFGLTFLLEALGTLDTSTTNLIWPVLVIIAGGTKMFHHKCGCC